MTRPLPSIRNGRHKVGALTYKQSSFWQVIGVPQPALKWFKDGEELKAGDIHRIMSGADGTCCLGTYTCVATNCVGSASSSAALLGFEGELSNRRQKSLHMIDAMLNIERNKYKVRLKRNENRCLPTPYNCAYQQHSYRAVTCFSLYRSDFVSLQSGGRG